MTPIHLAVVADIHHGADVRSKRGGAALGLLDRALAQAEGADAFLDLGDRISDEDAAADTRLQREVTEAFARSRLRRHHVCGNHDVAHLTITENEAILNAPLRSRAVEVGSVRIAFWQPDVSLTPSRPFSLAEGDLDELRAVLDDERPTILVTHPPISGQDQTGNHWFENNPAHASFHEDLPAIRKVLAEAPCPLVVLAGHVHWNSLTIVDAIPHLTLQSLSESCTTDGSPSGCAARLTIGEETLRWQVTGLDAFEVAVPFPRRKRQWMPPLPRFDTIGFE